MAEPPREPKRRRDPAERASADTPIQAALRRAVERAVTGELPEVPPRLKFELRRKVLHVATAILAVPMLMVLPFLLVLGLAFSGIAVITATWIIERRRLEHIMLEPYKEYVHAPLTEVLQKTRRPGEDFPWSPVLYTLSLILIGLAHQFLGLSWAIAFAAYAILGIGDAASALVGVAYGRHKLPWNRKKSWEGTLAGLVSAFLAGAVFGSVPFAFAGLIVAPLFYVVVLVGAAVGMFAETLPGVEDNFVVPISSAAVMFLLASWLQLGLPS